MAEFNLKFNPKAHPLTSRAVINILFTFALIVTLAVNALFFFQISKFADANKMIVHTHQVLQTSNEILLDLMIIESLTRGFTITQNKVFLSDLDQKMVEMYQNLNNAKKLTRDNAAQSKNFAELEPFLKDRIALIKYTISFATQRPNDKKGIANIVNSGYALTNKISARLKIIYNEELRLLSQRSKEQNNISSIVNIIFLVANVLTVGILLIGIIILNINFSTRRIMERDKRKFENLLKGIIDGTNDIIAAVDANLCFLIFNQSFEYEFKQIFGKRPILAGSLKNALSHLPDQQHQVVQLWQRALQGEEFTIVNKFGDPNLSENIYECNFSAIYNEKGKVVAASAIIRNIESRIAAEKNLQITHDKLERAYKELKAHDTEISMLNEMEGRLQSCNSIEETLKIITIYCEKMLTFASGVVYLVNSSRNYLEIVAEWRVLQNKNEQVFSPEECWGLRQGKCYFYINKTVSILCAHKMGETNLAYICVPLLAQNDVIGMLNVELSNTEHATEAEIREIMKKHEMLINNLAAQLSLAMANIRLRETLKIRSIRDPLTGLFNRAYLHEVLDREMHRAQRNNYPITIVMMDIDHFKRFNDKHGHDAGDLVLREVARLLETQIRTSDIVCRYGGEEFLIVLFETDMPGAINRIEKIRELITHLELNFRNILLENISASFGLALYPKDGKDIEELVTAADSALYASKKGGRNRLTVYSSADKEKAKKEAELEEE